MRDEGRNDATDKGREINSLGWRTLFLCVPLATNTTTEAAAVPTIRQVKNGKSLRKHLCTYAHRHQHRVRVMLTRRTTTLHRLWTDGEKYGEKKTRQAQKKTSWTTTIINRYNTIAQRIELEEERHLSLSSFVTTAANRHHVCYIIDFYIRLIDF